MQKNVRSRGWCFTINNYKFKDLSHIFEHVDADYMILGFETGKCKTEHIQGYVYFKNARFFNSVKSLFPRAHLEAAKGTPEQNQDYCSKDDDFYEFGILPEPGKRTDLENLKKMVKEGATMLEIADSNLSSYLKYHKGIEKYVGMNKNEKIKYDNGIEIHYITPKEAIEIAKSALTQDVYIATCEGDLIGWDFQPNLIIYNPAKFDTYKLELLEKAGMAYKIRNGYEFIQIRPNTVYIVKLRKKGDTEVDR